MGATEGELLLDQLPGLPNTVKVGGGAGTWGRLGHRELCASLPLTAPVPCLPCPHPRLRGQQNVKRNTPHPTSAKPLPNPLLGSWWGCLTHTVTPEEWDGLGPRSREWENGIERLEGEREGMEGVGLFYLFAVNKDVCPSQISSGLMSSSRGPGLKSKHSHSPPCTLPNE